MRPGAVRGSYGLIGLYAALGVGLAVRAAGLGDRSLWFDESYTWWMARMPPGELLVRLRGDNSPPLFYLLLGRWMAVFGDSAVALRAPSVLCGLATVAGVYAFARTLLTGHLGVGAAAREAAWVPPLAAGLTALSPLQVLYGGECRMYALGAALSVWAAWALVRATDPACGRPRRWLVFASLAALFLYTHAFAALSLVPMAGVATVWAVRAPVRSRHAAKWAGGGFCLATVAFLPWLPTQLAQAATTNTRSWIPPLRSADQVADAAYALLVDPWFPPDSPLAPALAAAALGALAVAAVWRGRWADGVCLALGLGPPALAVAASASGVPLLVPRYLIFAQPFLLVLLAITAVRVRPAPLAALAAATAVACHAHWCLDGWRRLALERHTGYRGAAAHLVDHRLPAEPVFCGDGLCLFPMLYHLRSGDGVRAVTHPDGWLAGDWALDAGRLTVRPVELAKMRGGVWVVARSAPGEIDLAFVPNGWVETERAVFREPMPEVFGLQVDVAVVRYAAPVADPP